MNEQNKEILSLLYAIFQGWLSILGMLSLVVEFGISRVPFTYEMALGYSFLMTAFALICGVLNTIPWFNNLNYRKVEK